MLELSTFTALDIAEYDAKMNARKEQARKSASKRSASITVVAMSSGERIQYKGMPSANSLYKKHGINNRILRYRDAEALNNGFHFKEE